jgi:hypothetical protein
MRSKRAIALRMLSHISAVVRASPVVVRAKLCS